MTENPYVQVALTYIRRPFASWGARGSSFWVLVMLGMGIVTFGGGRGAPPGPASSMFFMPFCFLFAFLAVHMKDQFADARARLTPGFRRAHAAVAVAAILVCTVVLPTAVILAAGWRSIGLVAVAVLLFDAVLWGLALNAPWAMLALAAVFIGPMIEPVRVALWDFVVGKHELGAVVSLLIGAAICWQGLLRLVRLTEDDPRDYYRRQWNRSDRIRMTWQVTAGGGGLRQRLLDWAIDRDMAALTRYAQRSPDSWWSRVCRWQVGMILSSTVLPRCLFLVVFLQIMVWFMPDTMAPGKMHVLVPGVFMFLMIPAAILIGQFAARWPILGREFLLPVTRRDYVRQLGLAAGLSYLRLWTALAGTLTLWWLVNANEPLHSGLFVRMLWFAAVVQVLISGVLLWSSSFRSRALAIAPLIGTVAVGQFIGTMCVVGLIPLPQYSLALASVVVVLIGVLFAWRGYRRWLKVDFD